MARRWKIETLKISDARGKSETHNFERRSIFGKAPEPAFSYYSELTVVSSFPTRTLCCNLSALKIKSHSITRTDENTLTHYPLQSIYVFLAADYIKKIDKEAKKLDRTNFSFCHDVFIYIPMYLHNSFQLFIIYQDNAIPSRLLQDLFQGREWS